MSTVHKPDEPAVQIQVSAYDRVSSWIVALLMFIGVAVFCLLVVWFSMWRAAPPAIPVPVRLDPGGGGDPTGVPGERLHVEGPERETVAEETDLVEPQLQETMAMVVDAVARKMVDLDQPALTEDLESGGAGGSQGNSRRRGFGHGPGLGGGGGATWEMQYDESTLAVYSQQLDSFGIELAVIGGDRDRIEYASGFTRAKPARRFGTRDEELKLRRTYFTHRSGTVQKYDEQLLARAGINTAKKIILQYYPKPAEDRLLILQQQYRKLEQEQILKTIFGVRRRGNAFEFYVVDQVRR